MAEVGTDSEAGVADALERALHVDALAVLAHTASGAFVHVHAEGVVSRRGEARLADTVIGSRRVLAAAVQADPRILRALVDVLWTRKNTNGLRDT